MKTELNLNIKTDDGGEISILTDNNGISLKSYFESSIITLDLTTSQINTLINMLRVALTSASEGLQL